LLFGKKRGKIRLGTPSFVLRRVRGKKGTQKRHSIQTLEGKARVGSDPLGRSSVDPDGEVFNSSCSGLPEYLGEKGDLPGVQISSSEGGGKKN